MDGHLVKLCLSAVRDADKWRRVLEHIMHETGSPAAIITLREKRTCFIVNDDALEADHHSPLICGFPPGQVEFYLNSLRTVDPWAEAQQTNYPFQPTLMSEICNPKLVEDQRFFDWLNSFGIYDSIAFELDRTKGFWTALNVFSFEQGSSNNQNMIDYLNAHYSMLQEAWRSTMDTTKVRQSAQATLDHLAALSIPACIMSSDLKVSQNNKLFEHLIERKIVKVSAQSGRLGTSDCVSAIGSATEIGRKVETFIGSNEPHKMSASTFVSDPMYQEKKEKYWLVTFQSAKRQHQQPTSAMELAGLSKQERALYEQLISGTHILPAGQALGIGRSRTYQVWDSIREKLGVESVHQLRWAETA